MAGPEIRYQLSRDPLSAGLHGGPWGDASAVHEKLTNSVQNEREKQTSSQDLRVASIAVTRTGTYAGARAFGTQMDEHEPQPAPEAADESLAWLDFLEECRQVLALSEQQRSGTSRDTDARRCSTPRAGSARARRACWRA